jgi:histidine ammonia-lyase
MQEDHNSMGWSAGLKLRRLIVNVSRILAVEAACAAQGLDLRRPLTPGRVTGAVLERIREQVPFIDTDAFMAPHLEAAEKLVRTGALVDAAEEVVGSLR